MHAYKDRVTESLVENPRPNQIIMQQINEDQYLWCVTSIWVTRQVSIGMTAYYYYC